MGSFCNKVDWIYAAHSLPDLTEMSHNNLLTWQTTVKFAKLSHYLALLPD